MPPSTSVFHGKLSETEGVLSVAGSSNVSLIPEQCRNRSIKFTGALTASITVTLPLDTSQGQDAGLSWWFVNATTSTGGPWTLTVQAPLGTGVVIPQNAIVYGRFDGTNMVGMTTAVNIGSSPYRGGLTNQVTALTGQTGGTTVLTSDQARNRVITVAGTLTSNLTVQVPILAEDAGVEWTLQNNTSGAFTMTFIGSTGTGVTVFQGGKAKIQFDGTNMIFAIPTITTVTLTLSPASVAANTSAEQTFTLTGLVSTDVIDTVNKPTAQAGLSIAGWRVAGANSLGITFGNHTGSSIPPTASEAYKVVIFRG